MAGRMHILALWTATETSQNLPWPSSQERRIESRSPTPPLLIFPITDPVVDDVPSIVLSAPLSHNCIECNNPHCSKPGLVWPNSALIVTTYYCDAACQRSHWQEHMPDCRNVQSMWDGITGLSIMDVPQWHQEEQEGNTPLDKCP